jgi:mRNA-degrading endonuclease YafQ of YafQ-DinJ toxin-antitoxin module
LDKALKLHSAPVFDRTVKKLQKNEKLDLDRAIKELMDNPLLGEQKKGDLSAARVYKFRMIDRQALLAYLFDEIEPSLTFIAIGSHEDFYRDLKIHK